MMRTALLSAVFLFALAPVANAQNLPNGSACRTDHPSDCQSQYCAVLPGSSSGGTGVCSNTPLGAGGGNSAAPGFSEGGYAGGSAATSAQPQQAVAAPDAPNLGFVGVVQAVLGFIVRIGVIVAILLLAYAGYLFIAAQNDQNQRSDAQRVVRWAIIIALVAVGAQVIFWGLSSAAMTIVAGS